MFGGGFFANSNRVTLPLVILLGFVGATISNNALYWAGRFGGRPLITRILKVHFLSFLLDVKSLGKVERYFEEHDGKTVFVGRFGPGLRSIITPSSPGSAR